MRPLSFHSIIGNRRSREIIIPQVREMIQVTACEQRRLWLKSPIREWQSLWQIVLVNVDEDLVCFFASRLASACLARDSSKLKRQLLTTCFQDARSWASISHLFVLMVKAFMSFLQLYRSSCLPVGRLPCTSLTI